MAQPPIRSDCRAPQPLRLRSAGEVQQRPSRRRGNAGYLEMADSLISERLLHVISRRPGGSARSPGKRLFPDIQGYLDGHQHENCGAEGWAITASGTRGVLNDALSIYSRMPCSRAHSSPAGAPGRRSRRPGACSGCGSMNLSHGSGPHCTGLTVTGENRPTDCSNAADKPIKAATMPTLVLPPSLDPSRLQDHLIDTAAQAAGWISNHLRIVSRTSAISPATDLIVAPRN